MRTLKFTTSDKNQTNFAAAVRKNVNDYFKENGIAPTANIYMVLQTLVMLSLYIVPFILILTVPMNIWIALGLVVIMGLGTAGIGMSVMHDAVHGSYSRKEWVNKMFGSTMYLLGSNVFNWKVQHNILHHTNTNIDGFDGDIDSKGPIRLSHSAPYKKFHKYQHFHAFFFYGLMTLSKLVQDFTQLAEYNKSGITRQLKRSPVAEYIKMVALKLVYLFIFIGLTIFFTDFTWWQILIGFVVMHWTAGFILSIIFQLAHVVEGADQPSPNADGVVESDWAVHELATTSNFGRNNWLLTWYVGGLNFQIEHHLFPHICHVHYSKISHIVEKTANDFGLTYNLKPRFRDALRSHIRMLKVLGRPAQTTAA
ncbi:MAG: acyl-CoA desaturase [Saprospiraceae bacterium]|nr:acyl-CoA desaturase [Saprospiraceae bacterium]